MCHTAIQLHGWKGNICLRFIFNFHTENVFCAKHITKNIKGGIFLQISYLYLDICFIFYSLFRLILCFSFMKTCCIFFSTNSSTKQIRAVICPVFHHDKLIANLCYSDSATFTEWLQTFKHIFFQGWMSCYHMSPRSAAQHSNF